ncbi:cofactor assembly of complex C subunit B [Synechococcus elongatus IITB7]|uniref:cofactor assembly of complex C subunit B n=1 Tax=Synechococcus elongatus TaxID=32046 RepID=UPI0030CF6C4C
MATDSGVWLRRLPLVAGAIGGTLLMVNRALTPELLPTQSRSDALGILLSALLILSGLLWQRVQPVPPEIVVLDGEEGFDLDDQLPEEIRQELAWASKLLLTNTITGSLLLWYDGQVLLRRGILAPPVPVQPGPIVERAMKTGKAVYLVDLKLYPGRIEFNYLPANSQGLICQPIGDRGVLLLAARAPRSYTQQDERWIAGIADKLDQSLSGGRAAIAVEQA